MGSKPVAGVCGKINKINKYGHTSCIFSSKTGNEAQFLKIMGKNGSTPTLRKLYSFNVAARATPTMRRPAAQRLPSVRDKRLPCAGRPRNAYQACATNAYHAHSPAQRLAKVNMYTRLAGGPNFKRVSRAWQTPDKRLDIF